MQTKSQPIDEAAELAVRTVAEVVTNEPRIAEARFVLFNEPVRAAFARALSLL